MTESVANKGPTRLVQGVNRGVGVDVGQRLGRKAIAVSVSYRGSQQV